MSRPALFRDDRRQPVYTVSEVTAMVRRALDEGVPPLSVEGEISNLRRPASGHLYFTLNDARSQLRCVLFRGFGLAVGFTPEDGMKVVAAGSLTVYEPRGEYQLRVERLQPAGLGELALSFLQLRDRLEAEGLFDAARKRELPAYPEVVGLVTSASGAAVRDMIRILRRRWPPIRIVLRPAPVQGAGAAAEIAAALDEMGAWGGADVVIVGRGGGSLEDLWAFNEETVARAIARCPIPVISAVGHEIDVTIADFAADVRAPTPSAAAEMAVPVAGELRERILEHRMRLDRSVLALIESRRRGVAGLARSRALGRPRDLMDQTRQRLDELLARMSRGLRTCLIRRREALGQAAARLRGTRPRRLLELARRRAGDGGRRLEGVIRQLVERERRRLEMLGRQLEALGPQEVLERGFCIAMRPDGRAVRAAEEAPDGTPLALILARGRLRARSEGPAPEEDETAVSEREEERGR